MKYKLMLSFGALMTSIFLVKIVSAEEINAQRERALTSVNISEHLEKTAKFLSKVKGLKAKGESAKSIQNAQRTKENVLFEEGGRKREDLFFKLLTNSIISDFTAVFITDHDSEETGKKVKSFNYKDAGYSMNNTVRDGGRLYIGEASVSRDTIIENKGIEFVKNLSNSEYAIVKKGGEQIVTSGANAEGAKIYGGKQVVVGKGIFEDGLRESSAYYTEIYSEGGSPGLQNIYDGGIVFDTKIMKGGIQNVNGRESFSNGFSEDDDTEDKDSALDGGAFAIYTEVFKDGIQNIFAEGNASEVMLYDRATQQVYADGYVDTLTIHHQAKSWVYLGAVLHKETVINDFGSIYIYAGNNKDITEVEEIILKGEDTKLYPIATEGNGKRAKIKIENLSGNGRVAFISTGGDDYYSQLNIDHLSGNLHFDFNVDFANQRSDYLFIKKSSSGHHTISVVDTGVEITNPFHKKLQLVSDRSGNAHFSLTNSFGEKIRTIDAGTYTYSLKHSTNKDTGKIWYLDANYALDRTNNPLFLASSSKTSSALLLNVLTEFTVEKNMVISIADPNFNSLSEGINVLDNHNAESSINNTVRDGGRIYVYNGGFNLYTTIENGGIEIIESQGLSQETTVYRGGQQRIKNGGKAEGTKIHGGQQFVSGGVDINGEIVRSSAYNTVISGQNGGIGYQNVYDGGMVFETKIMEEGVQNLYIEDESKNYSSSAFNTEVFSGGEQNVLVGGEAIGVVLYGTAVQKIELGGYVKNLTVNDQAKSWLHHGATLEGRTIVNDSGRIYLYAGTDQSRTEVEKIILKGKDAKLYSIASPIDGESSLIENLSGNGSVIFTSSIFEPHYSRLEIHDLSGNLHFRFNTDFANKRSDYLLIRKGTGHHKISIIDSGIKITNSSLINQDLIFELDLIHDQGGKAHFTLTDFSGEEISAIDNGVYIYALKKKNHHKGNIWSLFAVHIDNVPRRGRFSRHLNQKQSVSFLSKISSPIDQTNSSLSSEEQQQSVVSTDAASLADQILLRPSNQDQLPSQLTETLSVSDFLTTPSTDAVLSLSVAPQFIFHNELQTVRAGRGMLERSKKHSALWASAIKSKESVSTGHLDFKLEQTGVVLGLTAFSELTNGDFYLGGFGSYDQARVAHARGGTSSVNTYGIGAYASYFSHSGWYLDSILKYNHYQNALKAVSTNGLDIEGNYKQRAVGASFEGGYRMKMAQSSWMQPYAQFTWLRAEGKEITLSNKMMGTISPLTSLRSEVGLSLGYEFGSSLDSSSIAYITAAWLRENKNDNHTTINKHHKFITDLSGDAGKLGIGLSSLVSDKLKLYAEAHYVKGRKVKQLLQGTLGVRYSF
ncbi:BafA family autotransporter [Bartonella machadoae]|uniref:BafA family autotransporter n=1 Tax=Bartonella machadoae TaxID=2893471 RepID=UPI001F4C9CDA|nr:BafA family autotransporter [Bartonella machadoae]UNE53481.1 BafA family autotransporter [Bartonella machadoae]